MCKRNKRKLGLPSAFHSHPLWTINHHRNTLESMEHQELVDSHLCSKLGEEVGNWIECHESHFGDLKKAVGMAAPGKASLQLNFLCFLEKIMTGTMATANSIGLQ